MKKKLISIILIGSLVAGGASALATGNNKIKNNILLAQPAVGKIIVTVGANNTWQQRQELLKQFNVNTNDSNITFLQTTNREIAKELGFTGNLNDIPNTGSYSSAKITILPEGSGIQVTTNNLTEVTGDMLASALTTVGINNASIDADAPMPVTGQAALAGVLQAFQQATGTVVPEKNKKVANNEINTTASIAKTVGQKKAETIVNQAKSIVIKDNPNSKIEVQNIVNNVVNNNGGGLNQNQEAQLTNLMEQIKGLNLNYDKVEGTLKNIQSSIANGEKNFSNISAKLQDEIKNNHVAIEKAEGMLDKIWNWITSFFEGGEKAVSEGNQSSNTANTSNQNTEQNNNQDNNNSQQTQQQNNGQTQNQSNNSQQG
ncbi:DUF1002 domain-containing protein [uncultured Clostridium sp.]|jgi:uncharacterized protein YpuA (DUF1002 family)|uniref:DUF1002 domain-containing protein n=1 Tax=uncultured Clostridium sp. TaxID=59620 RepID=UPI0026136360|nr:DUF1002 domain-containing protein [uncultured Clostridium sp.]